MMLECDNQWSSETTGKTIDRMNDACDQTEISTKSSTRGVRCSTGVECMIEEQEARQKDMKVMWKTR